jgi:DNA adenine methylase
LELGFSAFFLNRTNRSGIFSGGIIGGRDQKGTWKIDARYNKQELISRIEDIAKLQSRVAVSQLDAVDLLRAGFAEWPSNTLIYLDPPYYVKGKDLYFDFYTDRNHRQVAALLRYKRQQKWIISYDDMPQIRKMYRERRAVQYTLSYSARDARRGREIMFFCDSLEIPQPALNMQNAKVLRARVDVFKDRKTRWGAHAAAS